MKALITLLLVATFITASAQKTISVQLGPNYSTYKDSPYDFSKSIGYFAGVTFQDKVTDVLGVDASLYFLNQRSTINEVTTSVRSVNAIFAVDLYAGHSGLYFIVGPELGHSIDYRFEGEDLNVDNDIRFSAVGGVGYQLNAMAGVFARFHYAIDDQGSGYDYNVQAGFKYTISTH